MDPSLPPLRGEDKGGVGATNPSNSSGQVAPLQFLSRWVRGPSATQWVGRVPIPDYHQIPICHFPSKTLYYPRIKTFKPLHPF